MLADLHLAQLLCARLCHDLGGAVGTLGSTLDLAGPGDDELQALARETAGLLRQRLRLYSAAWGMPGEDRTTDDLAALLAAAPAAPRVRFVLDGLARGGTLPGTLVPLVLNAALLAAEALPRGGTVAVSGGEDGLLVLPDGTGAAWPQGLMPLLAGGSPAEMLEEGPRRVLAPLVLRLAAAVRWEVSFALGAGPGPSPLVLGPA